jgi:hypothetical protein
MGEVSKDSRHIDSRVQSLPFLSFNEFNSYIVAPCNELVDIWCRMRIRHKGLLSFGPEIKNLVEV